MWSEALNFTGKQVLVTGGSDGIGLAIARAFREAGARVTVTGTRSRESYEADFTGLAYEIVDVTNPASVDRVAEAVTALDVLINCVGTVLYREQEFTREGFERVVSVNLSGVMHLCTGFKDALAQRQGCIVNVDSAVARIAAAANPAYSASKAGLVHLTAALAARWGRAGLRVNGIGPGLVPTKLTANQMSSEAEARFRRIAPLGRMGTPEDIAGVALFLASPLASYVTGQSLAVDGGVTVVSALGG